MKNKIYNEYQNYKDYINDYFGRSKLNENISLKEIKEEFEQIVILSKICQCLSDDEKVMNYTRIIEYNLNNIIYFMPMNEKVSINTSIRNSVEYTLKLIFYFQNKSEDFLKKGYRTMKEEKDSLSIYSIEKNKIDSLFEVYARRSNLIHLKTEKNDSLKFILEQKLMNDIDIREISGVTQDIKKCTAILLEAICFYEVSLATAQKIRLKGIVSNKWWGKICQIK